MIGMQLGLVLVAGLALHLEPSTNVTDTDRRAIVEIFAQVILDRTGMAPVMDPNAAAADCRTDDACVGAILTRTGATEVVFVRLIGRPAGTGIVAERTAGGGLGTGRAEVDLPRTKQTWSAFLQGAAIMLFPEGRNVTPPIVAVARPPTSQKANLPPMIVRPKPPPPPPKKVAPPPKTVEPPPPPPPKVAVVPPPKKVEPPPPPPKVAVVPPPKKAEPPPPPKKVEPPPKKVTPPPPPPKKVEPPPPPPPKVAVAPPPRMVTKPLPKVTPTPPPKAAKPPPKAKATPPPEAAKPPPKVKATPPPEAAKPPPKARTTPPPEAAKPAAAPDEPKSSVAGVSGPSSITTEPAELATSRSARRGVNPWPWVTVGITAVAVGAGTFMGIRNQQLITDGQAEPDPVRVEEFQDQVFQTGLAANILFGTAAVGAITSVVLFLFTD